LPTAKYQTLYVPYILSNPTIAVPGILLNKELMGPDISGDIYVSITERSITKWGYHYPMQQGLIRTLSVTMNMLPQAGQRAIKKNNPAATLCQRSGCTMSVMQFAHQPAYLI
jgi:hypothetical protein